MNVTYNEKYNRQSLQPLGLQCDSASVDTEQIMLIKLHRTENVSIHYMNAVVVILDAVFWFSNHFQ